MSGPWTHIRLDAFTLLSEIQDIKLFVFRSLSSERESERESVRVPRTSDQVELMLCLALAEFSSSVCSPYPPTPTHPPPPTPEELRDLDPTQALGGRAFLDWRATTSRQQTSGVRSNEKPWRGSRHGRFISEENGETRKGGPLD